MQVRIPQLRGLGDDILVTQGIGPDGKPDTYTLNKTTGDYYYSDGRTGNILGMSPTAWIAQHNAQIDAQAASNPTWTQGSGAVHGSALTNLPNPQQCDPSDSACIAANAALEKQRLAAYTFTKVPNQDGKGTGGNTLGPVIAAALPATVTTPTPVIAAPAPYVAPPAPIANTSGAGNPATTGNAGLNVPGSIWGGNYQAGYGYSPAPTPADSSQASMTSTISMIPTWALLGAAGLAAYLMFFKK